MKWHLNFIPGFALLAIFVSALIAPAADVTTTYPYPVPATSYAPADSLRSAASGSNAVIVALNAQTLLLKELIREHESRAVEQKSLPEKAKWETDLVTELQEKSERLQKGINQMSSAGADNVRSGGIEADAELGFLSTLEARLAQVREDLSAAVADSRVLSRQVATNKAPESIAAISTVLTDNQRLVKELEREQLDLELRRLEFRAIRKAMQK